MDQSMNIDKPIPHGITGKARERSTLYELRINGASHGCFQSATEAVIWGAREIEPQLRDGDRIGWAVVGGRVQDEGTVRR